MKSFGRTSHGVATYVKQDKDNVIVIRISCNDNTCGNQSV